jgi:hypothetical protein
MIKQFLKLNDRDGNIILKLNTLSGEINLCVKYLIPENSYLKP